MACGTLERLTVCPVEFRVASDLMENSVMVFEPTFPTSRKVLMGSNARMRGFVPVATMVVVVAVSEPLVPTENTDMFAVALFAT
jgi:hypothetical protein